MDTRVGAYAVIVQDGAVLLSHWNPRHPTLRGAWSLPGGGMEIGEQPAQTALREVHEETGFTVELDELLGVHSRHMDAGERLDGRDRPFHALRVIYRAHGHEADQGQLRHRRQGEPAGLVGGAVLLRRERPAGDVGGRSRAGHGRAGPGRPAARRRPCVGCARRAARRAPR